MAILFDRDEKTIRKHVNNVFNDGELHKESNTHFLRVPLSDKPVAFYNLDVIISVGYRVKSQRGVEFRRWATKVLKDYIIKGVAQNDRRLEQLGQMVQLLKTAEKHGDLIGHNLYGCHNERSQQMIRHMLATGETNTYTVTKECVNKLIFQTPWRRNGEIAGIAELSIPLPPDMPHFIRQ